MALHLLYGAPHSGCSEHIYDSLIREAKAHPERRYAMIVPEQASLTVQEELVLRHPDHALFNIDILTFERLAYRVFRETNAKTRDLVDDEGKLLFLQLAVNENREKLTDLRRSAGKIGMLLSLKSVFSEFAEYNVTPELLREKRALLETHPKLQRKLDDLTILYESFLNRVHERFDLVEERMSVLASAVKNWKQAEEVTVALDGFTGFTPPQYEVLEALIRNCRDVLMGFTVGNAYLHDQSRNPDDLFYMPDHAAEKVKELAIRSGVPYTEERISSERDSRPKALRFLESNLFGQTEERFREESGDIQIVRAATGREEIAFILREILKSIRAGYRYRDLAIVTGDPDYYREEMEEKLTEAGIPYFFDANRSLDHSPLIRLITDALWVCRSGFGFDSVFSFLKNPIVEYYGGECTSPLRISEVENFALARGFRSRSGYGKPWEGGYRGFDPERLEAVNETKDAALAPLLDFYDRMTAGKPTVRERIEALKSLLDAYRAEEGLAGISSAYQKETGEPLEKEYEAVTGFVTEYLTRAEELIGALTLSTEEFEDVMLAVLRQAEIGHVPPTKDRLLVGNLTRTRLGHVKKLFVLGANEGKLPAAPNGDGLLNDRDRATLKEFRITLAETAEENTFNNRYYLYLLFNEPSESLILTFSASENNGEGKFPAPIVRELLTAYPMLSVENASEAPFSGIYSENSGLIRLACSLRNYRIREESSGTAEAEEETRALYQWFRKSDLYEEALRQIGEGLFYHYQKEFIPKDLASKLYGEVIRGSVSRLEGFAACPYRHFLQYGLQIQPRTVYQLAASDLGSIAHNSIELFFRLLKEDHKQWQEISEEEQEDLITRSVNQVTAEYGNAILKDSARNSFLASRIRRIMVRTLWALSRQWSAGGFTETESELNFFADEHSPLFSLTAEEGIRLALSGRIDRIDLARDGKKVYVRIIDYKSGDQKPDYTKIYHGLQLQLLLYMQVAVGREKKRASGSEIIPAGVYYYTVQDPLVPETGDDRLEDALLKAMRMNGLTNSSPDAVEKNDAEALQNGESTVIQGLKSKDGAFSGDRVLSPDELSGLGDFSVKKAAELSKRIASGEIEAAPYRYKDSSACKYCDYRGVCGRDRRIRRAEDRPLVKKELEDLLGENRAGVD